MFLEKTNELLDWFSFGLPNRFCYICIINNSFPNTSVGIWLPQLLI